jgi:hypothetical protein
LIIVFSRNLLNISVNHQVAMRACPLRANFFAKLAADPNGGEPASQEKLNEKLDKWLESLSSILTRVDIFYEKGGYGKGL